MASTCCARWIDIGGTQIELNGVDDLLQKLYFDGWLPGDAGLDDALLKGLRGAGNHFHMGVEHGVATAAATMFAEYCETLDREMPWQRQ